mgnify:CR=1 FL=1
MNNKTAASTLPIFESSTTSVFVDCVHGHDAAAGTVAQPARSVSRGVALARALTRPTILVLRQGTCVLNSSVLLTAIDSGLTITSYPGERAVLSGARPLPVARWDDLGTCRHGGQCRVLRAALPYLAISDARRISTLRINGTARFWRARYPNGNPATTQWPAGWIPSPTAWYPPRTPTSNATHITVAEPVRSSGASWQQYMVGLAGPCSVFEPASSFWCNALVGGFATPSGLTFNATQLPHAPYAANISGRAIVHTFHPAHWASWAFLVDAADDQSLNWTLGGFQDARGGNTGKEWYVENVLDELDDAGEFFIDTSAPVPVLYLAVNMTDGVPADVAGALLDNLLAITGSPDFPVTDITLANITLTDTTATFLDPMGVPSGGDWSLQHSAAMQVRGAANIMLHDVLFERLDGLGLLLAGRVRNTTVQQCEFHDIGGTAMAAWGDTAGIDGTGGQYPLETTVSQTLVHEIGLFQVGVERKKERKKESKKKK